MISSQVNARRWTPSLQEECQRPFAFASDVVSPPLFREFVLPLGGSVTALLVSSLAAKDLLLLERFVELLGGSRRLGVDSVIETDSSHRFNDQ